MKFQSASALIILLCSLFVFNSTQAQQCIEFDTNINPPSCHGDNDGEILISIISGQGPFTFNWNDGLETTDSLRTDLSAGIYGVTVSSPLSNGIAPCTVFATILLLDPDSIILSPNISEISCAGANDGAINVNVLGPSETYDFNWSTGTTESSIGNLGPGTYSVTVTSNDNFACTATRTFVLSEPPAITVDSVYTDNPDCPGETGVIELFINGGVGGYLYQWNIGVSSSILENIEAGSYTVTVTDENDCTLENTYVVVEPEDLEVSGSVIDVSCAGESDGKIGLFVNGGTPPYTFLWSDESEAESRTDLDVGDYSVTVTDNAGCTASAGFVVSSPPALVVSCDPVSSDVSQVAQTGSFVVNISGGVPPYRVDWDGKSSNQYDSFATGITDSILVDSLPSDRYTITVTDANDCIDTCSVLVEEYFVVDEESLFIIEFDGDASGEDIRAFEEELRQKPGVHREKSCNCTEDTARLQLWYTERVLDINTSGETVKSKPKGDTSGLAFTMLVQYEDIPAAKTNICTHPETESNTNQDSIVVAIIDSGVNLNSEMSDRGHPDLDNLYKANQLENRGDQKDNDGNCCIDDWAGYDYVNEDSLVIDRVGHGTHLTGIVADAYPGDITLKIINLKVYDENEAGEARGNVFDLTCAIHYAIQQGAKIINLSLGYFDKEPSKPLYRALKKAADEDILIVVSAGNDTLDLDLYEKDSLQMRWPGRFNKNVVTPDSTLSELSNIIVVAALDSLNRDIDFSYSNFGRAVVGIAANANFYSTHLNEGYLGLKGTSMSAAYLTRIFSIIRAHNDTLSAAELIQAALDSAVPIPSGDKVSSGGKFDESLFLQELDIDDLKTREQLAPPPSSLIIGLPDNRVFLDVNDVDITIKLGSDQEFFQNVVFTVYPVGRPNNVVYQEELCKAGKLHWNGDHKDGGKVPDGIYEFTVEISGKSFSRPAQFQIGGQS